MLRILTEHGQNRIAAGRAYGVRLLLLFAGMIDQGVQIGPVVRYMDQVKGGNDPGQLFASRTGSISAIDGKDEYVDFCGLQFVDIFLHTPTGGQDVIGDPGPLHVPAYFQGSFFRFPAGDRVKGYVNM